MNASTQANHRMSVPTLPIRFAIVGCGQIAHIHAERLRADGRGTIVALVDSEHVAAEKLRFVLNADVGIHDDLAELIDQTPLDAVVICTPTHLHYEQVSACLERGLHVLCEKPLADTRQRIGELIQRSARRNRHLCVAYQRRFQAAFRTMRREVQSGRWGAVRAVSAHNYEGWQKQIACTWRDDPAFNPGGFIGDAGSHKIDTVFYVTGLAPAEVYARCATSGSHVEVLGAASALLAGGVPWNIDFVGNARNLGEDLYVHCEEADLMIRDGSLWIGRPGKVELFGDLEANSDPDRGFVDLLLGESQNIAPPECALPVHDFTRAMLESSRTGQNVVVPKS